VAGRSATPYLFGVVTPKPRIEGVRVFLRRYGMEYMGFQNMRDDVRRRCRLRLAGRTNDRHFREAVDAIAARQASCDIEFQESPKFSCWSVTTLRSSRREWSVWLHA
jgi:hypothetical protein